MPIRARRSAPPRFNEAELDGALDQLLAFAEEQSARYAERAREMASPCLLGCSECCHRLVLVDLFDAFIVARHLRQTGAWTPELEDRLLRDAACAEAQSPDEYVGVGRWCLFLRRDGGPGACTIYSVRPLPCRTWFITGVPDSRDCGPMRPSRELSSLRAPDLDEADFEFRRAWLMRVGPRVGVDPKSAPFVPLSLGVLAARDVLEEGWVALSRWRVRLGNATQRSYRWVDEQEGP